MDIHKYQREAAEKIKKVMGSPELPTEVEVAAEVASEPVPEETV